MSTNAAAGRRGGSIHETGYVKGGFRKPSPFGAGLGARVDGVALRGVQHFATDRLYVPCTERPRWFFL